MAVLANIDAELEQLQSLVGELAEAERERLRAEKQFLEAVRASYDAASSPTKNAQVEQALADIDELVGVKT